VRQVLSRKAVGRHGLANSLWHTNLNSPPWRPARTRPVSLSERLQPGLHTDRAVARGGKLVGERVAEGREKGRL